MYTHRQNFMKKTFTHLILMSLILISACDQKNHSKKQSAQTTDPVPKTITQQEVARIALLEAEQLLNDAQQEGFDVSVAKKTHQQAKALYDKGAFKKAQITAVDVRHQIDDIRKAGQ